MLVGCGFGLADTTGEFIDRLLDADNLPPLVFDADGLKLLKKQPDWSSRLPSYSVLTPHPGEMSILCGLSVSEIQSSRLETALRFSQSWGHVVVLKGAFTVIASPDGQAAVIPVASPSLARAGTLVRCTTPSASRCTKMSAWAQRGTPRSRPKKKVEP